MLVEWTTTDYVDISEEKLTEIVNELEEYGGYDYAHAQHLIYDCVEGLDDYAFYNWSDEATEQVCREILRRMGVTGKHVNIRRTFLRKGNIWESDS